MGQHIRFVGPTQYGFPEDATSGLEIAAMKAMQAGGVKGLIWPTYGTDDDYAVVTDSERYVQDALFPAIEYRANHLTTGVPTLATSSTAPSMSWAGVSNARGLRAEDMVAAGDRQCPAGSAGNNPDFWLIAVAQLGTLDGDVQVIGGVNTSYTGYGEALVQASSGNLACRLGSSFSYNFTAAAANGRTDPHIFAARYTKANDTLRLYLDGSLNASYGVAAVNPTCAFVGGSGYFGGRAGSLAQEQLNAANSAFRMMAFGNGIFSDTQWTAVHAWLKAVFGIA